MKRSYVMMVVVALLGMALGAFLDGLGHSNYTPGSMSVDRNGNPVPAEAEGYPGARIQPAGTPPNTGGGNSSRN